MIRPELEIALRNAPLAFAHPRWWLAFMRGGRRELIRLMIEESVRALEATNPCRRLEDLPFRKGVSPFAALGATQEYLYDIVRLTRPRAVVETGVYRGISSAFILAALEQNGRGHLYSVDLPSTSYEIPGTSRTDSSPLARSEQTGFAVPERYHGRWTLILGDVREKLAPLLDRLGSIDLFYHDSEHTKEVMTWEYNLAWERLAPGGILSTDDYTWNTAFDDFVASHTVASSIKLGNRLGVARKPLDIP